jgi:SAM-dependent methyltransferase
MIHKTWNEFWGPLLMIQFHEGNPELWSVRRSKAEWIYNTLRLPGEARVLDLGCGDGMLDICLAELGATVRGVDRLTSVLDQARTQAGPHPVEFIEADLRKISLPAKSFDAVLLLEVVGLMNREEDSRLIARAYAWLRPGGQLLVDCPCEPAVLQDQWTREFPDGRLRVSHSYHPTCRIQRIEPTFRRPDGVTFDLLDPYDPSRGSEPGVSRYLYPVDELRRMLSGAGFTVQQIPHPAGDTHYMLKARAALNPPP